MGVDPVCFLSRDAGLKFTRLFQPSAATNGGLKLDGDIQGQILACLGASLHLNSLWIECRGFGVMMIREQGSA